MKKLLTILMLIPFMSMAQGQLTLKSQQGTSNTALYQYGYVKLISGEMVPILSGPPPYKTVIGTTDTIRVNRYMDSATRKLMDLQPDGTYAFTLSSAPNQTLQASGLNVVYQSPNVFDSHQGVTFGDNGYCFGIASTSIRKRLVDNNRWGIVDSNTTPFMGVPGSLNHLGGSAISPFRGRLVCPATKIVNTSDACLDTINHNNTIIEYDTSTLDFIRYKTIDSIVALDGVCFTPDGHMWGISFCDDNYLYEYDSAYNFIAKHLHTGTIVDKQGLSYDAALNAFYVASNNGLLYTVNKTTGASSLVYYFQRNPLDAFENVQYHQGVIKWTIHNQIGFDGVVYISDSKKITDYSSIKNPGVGIPLYSNLSVISNNNNGIDTSMVYLQSNVGSVVTTEYTPGGSSVDNYKIVGGAINWKMSARPNNDYEYGAYKFYTSQTNGMNIDTNAVLTLNRQKRVGINTNIPFSINGSMLNIANSGLFSPTIPVVWYQGGTGIMNTFADVVGGAGDITMCYADNALTSRASLIFRKASGVVANPARALIGAKLGSVMGSGFDSPTTFINSAEMSFEVDGTTSSGNMPTSIKFYTAATNTRTLALTIGSNQKATFANSVTAADYKISALNTAPATATATGTTGEIRYATLSGTTYIFVCIATNTWVRAALATW